LSRLVLEFLVPDKWNRNDMQDIVRAITSQVNKLSEGRLAAQYNAQASVPSGSVVSFAVGDFIPDSNCTVRGSVAPGVAASYVRRGWRVVAPGTGATATFVEVRELTGT